MKPCIMLSTRLKNYKNKIEEDFFQLLDKSLFGNTTENIRYHKDVKLVTRRKKYIKHVMKLNFKDGYLFSKYLFALEMGKTEIKMKKLVYLE